MTGGWACGSIKARPLQASFHSYHATRSCGKTQNETSHPDVSSLFSKFENISYMSPGDGLEMCFCMIDKSDSSLLPTKPYCYASIKIGLVLWHVFLSCCLKKKGKQAIREAELGKTSTLPEVYKLRVLVLPPLQPASYAVQPKAPRKLLMSAVSPLPKHMDFRIMITGHA